MTDQLSLFEATQTAYGTTIYRHAPVTVPEHEHDDIDARFAAWIKANPHVLDEFCRRAFVLKQAGYWCIRGKRIVEEMRDDYKAQTTGDKYKLNNSFTSRLARAAVERHPELDGFFEFRELRS